MRRWLAALAVVMVVGACSTTSERSAESVLTVVASTSAWGSLASSLGGDHVRVTSIVSKPDADPHDYEPTAGDARTISEAALVIVNGVGYDEWATRIVDANGNRSQPVLDVGRLVGARAGDNPHRWYFPADVDRVVDELTASYKHIDPAHAADYDQRHDAFVARELARYDAAIDDLKRRANGARVGATESLFEGIASAVGLDITTPRGFITAVTEGLDPTVQDRQTFDEQVTSKSIQVLVMNPQNQTPDVQAIVDAAREAGVPVVSFTETLVGANFVDWQVAQLDSLARALPPP